LHPSLGNRDIELTCTVFGFNATTFRNWVKRPQYYGKWVAFVSDLAFAVVLDAIPDTHKAKYASLPKDMRLVVPDRFKCTANTKSYVSSSSSGSTSRHMKRKQARKGSGVVYITKTERTVDSGRKIKYREEADFIVAAVIEAWETGNPLSRSRCYDLLVKKFAGDPERLWTKKMNPGCGFITPGLAQWLTRTLEANGFSVRKESISQSVPINWLMLAVEATDLIRTTMAASGVTRLVNMDEMFLNYYPKEDRLIVPTNAKRVGVNRKEDEK